MSEYPFPAFYFSVRVGDSGDETSFQAVDGLSSKLESETLAEGGENRFARKLPTGTTHDPLVLKRAVGLTNSQLVRWCKETLEGGLSERIRCANVTVNLLDESGVSVCSWLFSDCYPVAWSIEGFDATKNSVAIEQMTFNYSLLTRTH